MMSRKHLRLHCVWCCVVLCVIGANRVWAGDEVLKLAGVSAEQEGVCLVLDCRDGKLAADLAQKTKYFVFALARDEADCAKTRETLEKAGLYGERATAVVSSPDALPFPKGYGNLIVAENFNVGAKQASPLLKEVRRVLNPNGVAVVGGVNVDGVQLKAALDQAEVKDYRMSGSYAVIRGRMPEGSDDWTHWRRAPDSHAVSADASIRPPFRTRWIDLPGHFYPSSIVIAQGRYVLKDGQDLTKDRLFGLDVFNGRRLWERELRPPATMQGSMVLLGDRLYVIDGGDRVLVLDAGTAREVGSFPAPEHSRLLKLVIDEGVIYLQAVSPELDRHYDAKGRTSAAFFSLGDVFYALALQDGRLLWTHKCEKPAWENTVVFGDKALYYYSPETGYVAVELSTGKERWRNAEVARIYKIGDKASAAFTLTNVAVYYDRRVYLYPLDDFLVLDSRTGQLAWRGKEARQPVFINGRGYHAGEKAKEIKNFDPITGKYFDPLPVGGGRCVRGTGAPFVLFYHKTTEPVAYDLQTRREYAMDAFRTGCPNGIVPANGLIFATPYRCGCCFPVTASVALAPAGTWTPPDAGTDLQDRFLSGPAYRHSLTDETQGNWPSYRHDNRHSGVADVPARLPLVPCWERRLSGRLTAPSAADDMVFVGSQEGFVWGLDAGTGDMVWKFSCGGGVPVTPSYWRGRVFFGSMDGWVYAVEAKTGNLAWKFRAAPEEHYITLVGRITSSWPVQSGVLVEDGIAYFVGGVCSYDGVYLYGLDGESGKVVLAKEIGHVTPMGQGVSPQGAMISSGEVLLIPNGGDLPVSVRKSDGVVLWWRNTKVELEGLEREMRLASFYNGGGEEILAGDDAFLVGGGHRLGDRGYPFIICDTASGTPYGLIAAYKSGKIKKLAYGMGVFVPAGAASFARRPNPVLAEDLLVTGVRDGIAAYAWKKMTETSLLSKEERIARAELWKTNAPAGANSIVLAGGQILLAGTSDVVAVNKEDRRTLGTLHVEGQVQPNSLTAARGKLFLVTEDGRVLCLNK